MKTFLEYQLFRAFAFLIRSFSLPSVRRLSRFLTFLIYYVVPIRRAVTLQQLRAAFPELPDNRIREIAFGSYVNLVTVLLEMLWIPNLKDEKLQDAVHLVQPDVVPNIIRRGKGVIILMGHFGNWEMSAVALAKMMGISITFIVHPQKNKYIADAVNDIRSSKGNVMVDWKMGVRHIYTALRSRGCVGILADQSGPQESIFIPFFNRPAATYEGPAIFALRFGVPLCMVFPIRRSDGNYDLHAVEVQTDDLHDAGEKNIRELTGRHVCMLEEYIRKYPDLWLWQHKRWKHSPPAGQQTDIESP